MLPVACEALRHLIANLSEPQQDYQAALSSSNVADNETTVSRAALVQTLLQLTVAALPCAAIWRVLPLWLRARALADADRIAGYDCSVCARDFCRYYRLI
jgi:hypothetical protein